MPCPAPTPSACARVLAAARDDPLSYGAVAARFRVGERSISTGRLWRCVERESGAVAPKPHAGGARSKVDAAGAAVLEALVAERHERTLAELADGYRGRTGIALSTDAVGRQPRAAPASGSICGGTNKEPGGRRADPARRGRGA